MSLSKLVEIVEKYPVQTRANAFNRVFHQKTVYDLKSPDYSHHEDEIDSLKMGFAASFYALTVPEKLEDDELTEDEEFEDYLNLCNEIVSEVNHQTISDIPKYFKRQNADMFLNASFAVSNTNLEYWASWQQIEFFENFDKTIEQICNLKNVSEFVKYVVANECGAEVMGQYIPSLVEIYGSEYLNIMLTQLPKLEWEEIQKNSWNLKELSIALSECQNLTEVYNILKKKLLPVVWDESGLFYFPNHHGIFQITVEHMFLTLKDKKLKAMQTQFEKYVYEIVSNEFRRIDDASRMNVNYYLKDDSWIEQDLLVQSKQFAWIFEIKSSKINLGIENGAHARNKLNTVYKSNAVKAFSQIDRVIWGIKKQNKFYEKDKITKIKISNKIRKFIGITVTLWNFSTLAHQQSNYQIGDQTTYPLITVFDLQYILKNIKHISEYSKLKRYFESRVETGIENNYAPDFDELNLYELFMNNETNMLGFAKNPDIVLGINLQMEYSTYEKLKSYSSIAYLQKIPEFNQEITKLFGGI